MVAYTISTEWVHLSRIFTFCKLIRNASLLLAFHYKMDNLCPRHEQLMTFQSRHSNSESSKYPLHTNVMKQTKIWTEYLWVFEIKVNIIEIVRFQSRMPVLFKTVCDSLLSNKRFYIHNTLHFPNNTKTKQVWYISNTACPGDVVLSLKIQ